MLTTDCVWYRCSFNNAQWRYMQLQAHAPPSTDASEPEPELLLRALASCSSGSGSGSGSGSPSFFAFTRFAECHSKPWPHRSAHADKQAVRARAACSSALRAHSSPWCRSLGSSRSACHSVDTSGPRAPPPPALPTRNHHPCSTHTSLSPAMSPSVATRSRHDLYPCSFSAARIRLTRLS